MSRVTKPAAGASLLERAAKVYDFDRYRAERDGAPDPFALSLSQGRPSPPALEEGQGFDKLSPNGLDGEDAPFLDIPEEFRARPGEDITPPPPLDDGIVAVDRGVLAERGMIVPGAPIGPLAEEFRLVKRHLLGLRRLVADKNPEKAGTVLVCSARPGDGKTFCSINMALSLAAERDTEVLLVDADFAKPDIMRKLGLKDGPGLLDALDDVALDPEGLVIRTDVPGLSVLPAGTRTTADTELLASSRTRAVIARLLAANPRRIILFDSPPALAASPASVLATLVGQVVLVVRADATAESELREAVGLLDGCEHIELLLNAVSFVPGGRRFGSYYGQEDPK